MIKLPFLKLKIEKGDKMDKIRRLEEGLQGSFMFIGFFFSWIESVSSSVTVILIYSLTVNNY